MIRNIIVRELIYDTTPVSPALLPMVPYFSSLSTQDFSKPSKTLPFVLNATNLVANSQIDSPKISPKIFQNFPKSMGGWNTKVLYIEYIDGGSVRYCGEDFTGLQFLDTDSISSN